MPATGATRLTQAALCASSALIVAAFTRDASCAQAADAVATYPTKPVRLIVPYPPGGGSDIMGRAIAERLTQQLGYQFVVDNRAGASTAIGAELASRAAADGYTLLLGTITTLATTPNLRAKLPYDPVASFDPITLLASQPYYIVVNTNVPVRSVKELIAYARSKPGALHFGSPGVGSGSHLTGELFNSMADTKLVHVGYKGAGPAVIDLASGQTSLMFATLSTVHSMLQTGKLALIAVTTAKRTQAMPDVPTVAESGVAGFSMRSWNGLLGPRGLPKPVLHKLNAETVSALKNAEFAKRLLAIGFEPDPSSPEEFARFIGNELALHARIIKAAGLRVE